MRTKSSSGSEDITALDCWHLTYHEYNCRSILYCNAYGLINISREERVCSSAACSIDISCQWNGFAVILNVEGKITWDTKVFMLASWWTICALQFRGAWKSNTVNTTDCNVWFNGFRVSSVFIYLFIKNEPCKFNPWILYYLNYHPIVR